MRLSMVLGIVTFTCVVVLTLGENQDWGGFSYDPPHAVGPLEPGFAKGYMLTKAAQANNAKCLDGTSPVYYHRNGTGTGSNKWFITQQGGGWCQDIASCTSRATGALGSTQYDKPSMKLDQGYMALDEATNPLMYNWNVVFLRYCDGGSLSGDAPAPTIVNAGTSDEATLYFRGRAILDAEIDSLLNERGMSAATDVVVSGCSAGGLATFIHCDHWAAAIGKATNGNAKVVCMPDSGFFLDETRDPNYDDMMRQVYKTHQSSSAGLNAKCVAAESDPMNCIFAEHTLKYIATPLFMLQSQYDSWQSSFVAGACSGWPPQNCDNAIMNEFGTNLTAVVKAVLASNPKHGAFLDSCQHHCGGGLPPTGGNWNESQIDGDFQGAALKKWYELGSQGLPNKGFYNQGKPFPCRDCCTQGSPPVAARCKLPIYSACAPQCCNVSAYCGDCGNCLNTKTGDCAKCWNAGACMPQCAACYEPYPVPPGSLCDQASCSQCCEGGPCYDCQYCLDKKDDLCVACWQYCMPQCEPCWGDTATNLSSAMLGRYGY